jgi:hypothetical protein
MKAILTRYEGVNYRSMLEARWAAWFQLVGWPAHYEPFELAGYIPDFILDFPYPLLVEVKPTRDCVGPAAQRIVDSGWGGEFLIVTSMPTFGSCPEAPNWASFGWLEGDLPEPHATNYSTWQAHSSSAYACLAIGGSLPKGHVCLRHGLCSYRCRVGGCGVDNWKEAQDPDVAQYAKRLWAEAGNLVQWRGSRQ